MIIADSQWCWPRLRINKKLTLFGPWQYKDLADLGGPGSSGLQVAYLLYWDRWNWEQRHLVYFFCVTPSQQFVCYLLRVIFGMYRPQNTRMKHGMAATNKHFYGQRFQIGTKLLFFAPAIIRPTCSRCLNKNPLMFHSDHSEKSKKREKRVIQIRVVSEFTTTTRLVGWKIEVPSTWVQLQWIGREKWFDHGNIITLEHGC